MLVAMFDIQTPQDNPWGYDVDWRHQLAKVISSGEVDTQIPMDSYIAMQAQYLKSIEESGYERMSQLVLAGPQTQRRSVIVANRLYATLGENFTKDKIEALLLCPDIDYDFISRHFNMHTDDIEMYEKLFFNVRDEEGELMASRGLWEFFALQGAADLTGPNDSSAYWRKLAFEGGSKLLFATWGWPPDDEISGFNYIDMYESQIRNIFKTIDKRLRFDIGIDGKSVAQIFSDIGNRFAELQESGKLTSDSDIPSSVNALLQKFVEAAAPTMAAPSEESERRHSEALERKRESIRKSQDKDDREIGGASLDHISQQIKE